jgi:hypothetical protein
MIASIMMAYTTKVCCLRIALVSTDLESSSRPVRVETISKTWLTKNITTVRRLYLRIIATTIVNIGGWRLINRSRRLPSTTSNPHL